MDQQPSSSKQLHIVALGSSFASGANIPPIIDSDRNLSSANYPHLVATKLNARITDLSCSGATLLNLLSDPQELPPRPYGPQLDLLPSDADIVTLTGGGNDFGYSGSMISDAAQSAPELQSYLPFLRPAFGDTPPSQEEVTRRFVAVIDAVKVKAPKAKVYLVEYLAIFGDHASPETKEIPFGQDRLEFHKKQAEKLKDAYADAVKQRPETVLVEIAERSLQHGVGAPEPWVNGFDAKMFLKGVAPYHPIAAGHLEIARILYEMLQPKDSTKL